MVLFAYFQAVVSFLSVGTSVVDYESCLLEWNSVCCFFKAVDFFKNLSLFQIKPQ